MTGGSRIGRWLGVTGVALAAAIAGTAAGAAERPDLAGIWVLDRERSEDPWELLQAAGVRVRPDRGGLDGRRRHDHSRLVIRHREPEVTIFFPDGSRHVLFTDGRQLEAPMEQGYIEASARWKGSKLVFTGEKLSGATVNVEWRLAGEQLVVSTRLDGGPGGRRLSFRRFYDRRPAVTDELAPSSSGLEDDEPPGTRPDSEDSPGGAPQPSPEGDDP